ncbi:hypothetical protein KAI92_05135 [Candidatus Parcubacteria bacterium]|nr:hypothetical protein [Candidatus Parcubacteria bacterium]
MNEQIFMRVQKIVKLTNRTISILLILELVYYSFPIIAALLLSGFSLPAFYKTTLLTLFILLIGAIGMFFEKNFAIIFLWFYVLFPRYSELILTPLNVSQENFELFVLYPIYILATYYNFCDFFWYLNNVSAIYFTFFIFYKIKTKQRAEKIKLNEKKL